MFMEFINLKWSRVLLKGQFLCLYDCNKKTNNSSSTTRMFIGDSYVYSKLFSKQAQLKPTKTRNSVEREPSRKRIRQSVRECSLFNYKKPQNNKIMIFQERKMYLQVCRSKIDLGSTLNEVSGRRCPFLHPREGLRVVGRGQFHDFHCYETFKSQNHLEMDFCQSKDEISAGTYHGNLSAKKRFHIHNKHFG